MSAKQEATAITAARQTIEGPREGGKALTVRRAVLTIHLWAGLIAALVLFALGVSGSLMAFENEIDRALNPRLTWINPGAARLTLREIITKLNTAYPGYDVAGIEPSERNDVAWNAFLTGHAGGHSIAFNPYNGTILGNESTHNNFTGHVHQFHLRLLAGEAGGNIVTAAAVILLILAITGLVLWWPRKLLTVSWRSPWKKLNLEVHQVLGLFSSVFLIVFAFTALVIHWDDAAQHLVNQAARVPGEPHFPALKPLLTGKPAPDFDTIVAIAQRAEADARVTAIFMDSNPVRVIMKHPDDHTPAGRTNVFIDAYTQRTVLIVDWSTGSPGLRLVKVWNREIHTGDIGGLPTRILASVISLSLPLMAISGPLIWWNRRRRGFPSAE